MKNLVYGSNYKLVSLRVSQLKKAFNSNYKVLHCSEQNYPLYQALQSDGLFSEQNSLLIDISEIVNEEIDLISKLNEVSATNLIAYCEKIEKSKINKLSKFLEIEEHTLPTNKASLKENLSIYAKEKNIKLPPESFEYLHQRYGNDINPYYNLIDQFYAGSITQPSQKQIVFLSQGSNPILAPWDVLDLLVRKDFSEYISQISQLEYLPLCYYLSNRFTEVVSIQQDPDKSKALNPYSLNSLRPLIALAKNLNINWILSEFSEMEFKLKNDQDRAAFDFELFLLKINSFLLSN